MKRKIIIGVIVAAAVIIGVLSMVFSSNLPSNQKVGYNSTGIISPAPAPGHHYSIVLNETTIVTAHP